MFKLTSCSASKESFIIFYSWVQNVNSKQCKCIKYSLAMLRNHTTKRRYKRSHSQSMSLSVDNKNINCRTNLTLLWFIMISICHCCWDLFQKADFKQHLLFAKLPLKFSTSPPLMHTIVPALQAGVVDRAGCWLWGALPLGSGCTHTFWGSDRWKSSCKDLVHHRSANHNTGFNIRYEGTDATVDVIAKRKHVFLQHSLNPGGCIVIFLWRQLQFNK